MDFKDAALASQAQSQLNRWLPIMLSLQPTQFSCSFFFFFFPDDEGVSLVCTTGLIPGTHTGFQLVLSIQFSFLIAIFLIFIFCIVKLRG